MSGYGSAPVRAAATPVAPKQVHARQRLIVGFLVGLIGQFVLSFVLGFGLAGGLSWQVRVLGTLISSLIATPVLLSAGFALMLKEQARAFGGGVIAGAVVSTLLLTVLALTT